MGASLGADVPAERLEVAVASTRPTLAVLAAQQLWTAAGLVELAQLLGSLGVVVAYGGRVFNELPALRSRVPGHFPGEDLTRAPEVVEALFARPVPAPPALQPDDALRVALDHYVERLPLIEVEVWRGQAELSVTAAHLSVASSALARNLTAALRIGDLSLLESDLAWLKGLLPGHGIDPAVLRRYLTAYRRAADRYLDPRGQPILKWLEAVSTPDRPR